MKETPEIKRLERKLTIELLWIYVLSLLKKKPSHAYVLRKQMEEKFGFLPGNVSIYVVLYKLEKRGFVSSKYDEGRKVYSLTPEGKSLLKAAEKSLKAKNTLLFG